MAESSGAETYGILLLICSLACLGTWPALLRLCSLHDLPKSRTIPFGLCWPEFLERCCTSTSFPFHPPTEQPQHYRNICHVYLDYSTAYFFVSCLPFAAAILTGNEPSLTAKVPMPLIATAMIGGGLLSCGNLSLQWATAVFGAPLTTVLSIQASMTVILGTSLNYVLEPSMTHQPGLLLGGVVVFLAAIALATRAQIMYARLKEVQQQEQYHSATNHVAAAEIEILQYGSTTTERASVREVVADRSSNYAPHSNDNHYNHLKADGTQTMAVPDLFQPTFTTSAEAAANKALQGVYVAFAGGLCFGFFSPAFNIAVNDPFHWTLGQMELMTVARANLWFSFAFWAAAVAGNTVLLQQEQRHTDSSSSSTVAAIWLDYLRQDSLSDRQLALAAGIVCALGNVLQFQGGQRVGYAAADLVQAYPLVSTVWDVLLFGEFQSVRIPASLGFLLSGMYLAYLLGVILLAGSSIE